MRKILFIILHMRNICWSAIFQKIYLNESLETYQPMILPLPCNFLLDEEIQLTFTCSKSTKETLEKAVKFVQS